MADRVSYEGKRELRWLELGDCLVTYMQAEFEFSDKLWDDWLEAVRRPRVRSVMLCSWGPTQPSHQQWRRATRIMRERRLPVAVVTEARHNLALAKAASWLGTNIDSYRWHQLNDACSFAGFDREERVAIKAKIIALRDRFGPVIDRADQMSSDRNYYSTTHTSHSGGALEVSTNSVLETSEEIQTKLAEIQARLRARNLAARRTASGQAE